MLHVHTWKTGTHLPVPHLEECSWALQVSEGGVWCSPVPEKSSPPRGANPSCTSLVPLGQLMSDFRPGQTLSLALQAKAGEPHHATLLQTYGFL